MEVYAPYSSENMSLVSELMTTGRCSAESIVRTYCRYQLEEWVVQRQRSDLGFEM
jgi:hypothetical protein